jgi:DNA-3-methyladenine glycosylase II
MEQQRIPSHEEILLHFDERDPVIAGVVREYGPMKLKRNRNYFVVLCKAIIGQQISIRAAESITGRFHDLFAGRAPTFEKVLGLESEHLRSVGLSRQKVAYIQDLARHFQEKIIRPRQFHYLNDEEVIQKLIQVYGIGRWTAEMFLIFSLMRMDVLPVQDLGLQAGIKKLYGLREMPSIKKMRTMGKKWHPYQTVGTWYTWRAQDSEDIAY